MTIFDRLAKLDGACEHEWEYIETKSICFDGERWKCTKCSLSLWTDGEDLLPLVGDGNNEARYNSLDALYALCERLMAANYYLQMSWWVRYNNEDGDQPKYFAEVWRDSEDEDTIGDILTFQAENDDPRQALATAICRAMGVRE